MKATNNAISACDMNTYTYKIMHVVNRSITTSYTTVEAPTETEAREIARSQFSNIVIIMQE